MDFVSVERIVELLHLEQEGWVGGHSQKTITPPAAWPPYGGDIIFDNVTLRYAPHLDPALKNINLTIPGGSTTALLGRTGSGKSTLALSLLATIPPSCEEGEGDGGEEEGGKRGSITLAGLDIADVDKQMLRSRITFLAQDPVLFPGTLRQNLDPLSLHSDEDCASVLERVASKHGWKLETIIEAGGENLSQGQRQLVGLARAVLRRSSVVILDEATASIDAETAEEVQKVLREELRGSTVVVIAHRLEAVRGADFFVRLERGRAVEQGRVGEEGVLMDGEGNGEGSSESG